MRLTSRVMCIVMPILTLLVGGLGGFAAGQRQGMAWGDAMLERQVSGVLSRDVEVAACIRVSDPQRALQHLDTAIDRAVLTLSPRAGVARRGLGAAKMYRTAVAPSGADAARVVVALSAVPMLQPAELGPKPSSAMQQSGLTRLANGVAK